MEISLPYGSNSLRFEIDAEAERVAVLKPRRGTADPVNLALAAPIGSPPLRELVRPGQSVVILISDVTRPCPSHLMLPPLVAELNAAGIPDDDILVVSGLGTHRPQTRTERDRLIGPEMAARLVCVDSDPRHVRHVGTTSRGTPIEAFVPVVEADVRIALGNVEPHYFAGYSGGAKALVPGVCSENTIRANHAMMVDVAAQLGVLDGNPVREDIEEGAALIGLDFILNVIVDENHQIVAAAAGHPVAAHRWLCRVLDYQSKVIIDRPADIVVVSAGGYPKDINLYQAQKALDNAAAAVRPGGQIIWLAECREGFGNPIFESWMIGHDADAILARIRENFVLGGHKAAAIARTQKRAEIGLVSTLPADVVRACGMRPFADVETAFTTAQASTRPSPSIAIMPEGAAVVPYIRPMKLQMDRSL
jgi:nickel-dependent lactate racemase